MKDSVQIIPAALNAKKHCRRQNRIDFMLMVLFLALAIGASVALPWISIMVNQHIVLSIVIMVFAAARMSRLVIADHVMQWLRDMVFDVEFEPVAEGTVVTRREPARGLRRELAKLMGCQWCLSVWLGLLMVVLWFLVPYSRFVFFLLAISEASVLVYGLTAKENSSQK